KLAPLFFALLSGKLVLDNPPLVQHALYAIDLMWRTIDQRVFDLANRIENPEKLSEFIFSINYNALSLDCEQFEDSLSFVVFLCGSILPSNFPRDLKVILEFLVSHLDKMQMILIRNEVTVTNCVGQRVNENCFAEI